MKVEELSYSSVAYRVTADQIQKVDIRSIRVLDNRVEGKRKFVINEDRYADGYECVEGNIKAYYRGGSCIFFDLEEAKLEQAILREKEIAEAHKKAQNALKYYNELVLKYMNAPISNPE